MNRDLERRLSKLEGDNPQIDPADVVRNMTPTERDQRLAHLLSTGKLERIINGRV